MRVATVDIGSNTLLLLIAEQTPGGELVRVRDECRFGRLGKGLDRSGRLDPDAMQRSLEILREYRGILDEAACDRIAATGTEALRKAANTLQFLAPAEQILGVPVQVIAGEREAELVYQAVTRSFPELACGSLLIADVGGGSTEIVIGDGGTVRSFTSFPMGAVRMAERHLHSDPAAAAEARALIGDIDAMLAALDFPRGAPLIATSGTATTLGAVALKLRAYDPDRVHGLKLEPGEVERQLAIYLELTVEEKRRLPGLEPARADVIAAGTAILARIMHRAQSPAMLVSDRGVRWGLAYALLDQHA
jgi:exopolyphosphatase/guanosine-5'-triphosphate,3'-diphosphate pyrophosphatase